MLYAVFATEEEFHLVMEYCPGQNLFRLLKSKSSLEEEEVKNIIRQIVKAFDYLHTQDPPIIHRDLKPENVLYHEGMVKLADFGWSNVTDDFRNTFCGTPDYLSPEMIQGIGHTEKLDIWTIGILTYELLVGRSPFAPVEKNLDKRHY